MAKGDPVSSDYKIPTTLAQAKMMPDADCWIKAVQDEMDGLVTRGTFTYMKDPGSINHLEQDSY